MLLFFEATKLVARIFLVFIWFLTCAHLFFKFLTLGFQRWDLASDLLRRFLFWNWCMQTCFFFLSNDLHFPPPLMLSYSLLSKIYFSFRPIAWTNWVKIQWILRHLLPWRRSLVISFHKCWHMWLIWVLFSYTCVLCCQTVWNKFIDHCVGLVQIIRDLEWCFDLGHNRVLNFLEYKVDLSGSVEDISILIESCDHCMHVCEELI